MMTGKATDDTMPSNKKAKLTASDASDNNNTPVENLNSNDIRYVEFYSGVGGWTMALGQAIEKLQAAHPNGDKYRLSRLAALDHSDLCTRTFQHNFGSDKQSFAIERLSLQQVEKWNATLWAMSPPCQPHTRQHSNQAEDLNDPRSASFLHIIKLLETISQSCLPRYILLENVVGFESSASWDRWNSVLTKRGYHFGSFHLTPTQVGLPNDRPRYYCVAVQGEALSKNELSTRYLNVHSQETSSPLVHTEIPELGVVAQTNVCVDEFPMVAAFLDGQHGNPSQHVDPAVLKVPLKVLNSNAAWCFDIVSPLSRRSSCFTHSYGRYIKGTGSILYQDDTKCIDLAAPTDREFATDWSSDWDLSRFRYFSGTEMARLMGFQEDFSFPLTYAYKQQWKLIGNSLNVRVAARLVELAILCSIGGEIESGDVSN
eukprot:Nitzschia sp. Nitz4//scaffold48_size128905//39649//40935//NITZ4_003589-RA/size128905-processed-gene-0.111-mRNA-1//-1//CDS//3329552949//7476//frame0